MITNEIDIDHILCIKVSSIKTLSLRCKENRVNRF